MSKHFCVQGPRGKKGATGPSGQSVPISGFFAILHEQTINLIRNRLVLGVEQDTSLVTSNMFIPTYTGIYNITASITFLNPSVTTPNAMLITMGITVANIDTSLQDIKTIKRGNITDGDSTTMVIFGNYFLSAGYH
jgi:hypothetical protein